MRGGPAIGRHSGKGAKAGEVKPKGVGANAAGRTAAHARRPAGTFSRLAEPRGAQQAPRKRKGGCLSYSHNPCTAGLCHQSQR